MHLYVLQRGRVHLYQRCCIAHRCRSTQATGTVAAYCWACCLSLADLRGICLLPLSLLPRPLRVVRFRSRFSVRVLLLTPPVGRYLTVAPCFPTLPAGPLSIVTPAGPSPAPCRASFARCAPLHPSLFRLLHFHLKLVLLLPGHFFTAVSAGVSLWVGAHVDRRTRLSPSCYDFGASVGALMLLSRTAGGRPLALHSYTPRFLRSGRWVRPLAASLLELSGVAPYRWLTQGPTRFGLFF